MKTIFVLLFFLSAVIFALLYIAEPAWALLVRVPGHFETQHFREARQQCERVLTLRPSLFAESARSKIGVTHLAAAQYEIEKNHFSAAQHWLVGLLKRTDMPTGSEAEAGYLLHELPALHYQRAHTLFLQKDYEPALAEYEELERLYQGDPILKRARPEACQAVVELAKQLNATGDPEAALDRLSKLQSPHLPPQMVKTAWNVVPDLSARAIQGRLDRGEYDMAFALMQDLGERFPGDPELFLRLKDLRAQFDLRLFLVALEDPTRQRKSSSAPALGALEGEKVLLSIQNELQYPLRLIYVGPQRAEISVPAHSTRKETLVPGHYLAGMYSPGTHKFRPSRQQVVFRAGESLEKIVRSVEGGPLN